VDGTGPEQCPMMRFSVNGVESLGYIITVLNGVGFTNEWRILLLTTTRSNKCFWRMRGSKNDINTPAHEVIHLESQFAGLRRQCNATCCFVTV